MESLRRSTAAFNIVPETPVTPLEPNCISAAIPLDPSPVWRGGTYNLGNNWFSISPCPGFHPGEFTPTSPYSVKPLHGSLHVTSHICSRDRYFQIGLKPQPMVSQPRQYPRPELLTVPISCSSSTDGGLSDTYHNTEKPPYGCLQRRGTSWDKIVFTLFFAVW